MTGRGAFTVAAVLGLLAQLTPSVSGQTIPVNSTQVPAPAPADSVNAVVVGIGVVVLLALFSASFYFVVVWPKKELVKYRRKFERLVRRDQIERDGVLTSLRENGHLYGGLQAGGGNLPGNDDEMQEMGKLQVPTYKQIQSEQHRREQQADSPAGSPGVPGLQGYTAFQSSNELQRHLL